jgi:hypothetical protein
MGSTTVTGGGRFDMTIGAVTALGNVDLSGLTGTSSSSTIKHNDSTPVGVIFTGSDGADDFTGTGGADVITPGLGADTVTTGSGGDTITLTESVASLDEIKLSPVGVTLDSEAGLDTITGFIPAHGDKISFDLSDWTSAGAVFENHTNVAPSNLDAGVLLEFATKSTTLAAGADDGTILFVQAADTNAFSDVAITMTGDDTATYADGDGMPIVWYDNDGAFAEVGVLLQAGGAATTLLTSTAGADQYTGLLRLPMTKTVYDTFTGAQTQS